ncbi:TPA: hypothetical protein ACGHO4_001013 [Salmonella enterica subsp. diarizonae serovar 61:i:z]
MNKLSLLTPSVIDRVMFDVNNAYNCSALLLKYAQKYRKEKDHSSAESFTEANENVTGLRSLITKQASEIAYLNSLLNRQTPGDNSYDSSKKMSYLTEEAMLHDLESYNDSSFLNNVINYYVGHVNSEEEQISLSLAASSITQLYVIAQVFADEIVRLRFRLSYCPLCADSDENDVLHAKLCEGITTSMMRVHYDYEQSDGVENKVYIPRGLHPDTVYLVIDTADAMAEKLYKAQEKHGYTNGWRTPVEGEETGDGRNFWTREECLQALFRHMEKGDPIGCINYLAFMQANGWRTELPTQGSDNER